MRSISADGYRASTLKLAARIQTREADLGTIWMRIDGVSGAVLRFDNMMERPGAGAITGTTGWTELSYPLHDRDVMITACGRLCLHVEKINVSTVLAGQRVGIKEVDEGIWLVSFMSYDLGYFDLEQKTLQPLDNPFGPRGSHMS